ncbi:hypothetical protein QR674_04810 [Acinetobacter chinensis]|uniref:Uncharacterized protein n=1 Tax=Acinetobacter chinensis TaxID=2004650 RepID=A0ABU3WD24_9GAMM|nr:hypothetical protein [Acinetobacter chinensis]MDV2468298.1 hypothetical protein [Acinetobacter chinensis]
MNSSITFEGVRIYVNLVKLTKNLEHDARRTLKGFIAKENRQEVGDLLTQLEDYISTSSQTFPVFDDEDGEIIYKLPSFYNISLIDMLRDHPTLRNNLISEPTYFQDIDYIYTPLDISQIDFIENESLKNYIKNVTLFSLIKTQSDHHTTNGLNEETLYFLGNKKFSIINDLSTINPIDLNVILAFKTSYIDSQIHKEAIKHIIKDSLISFYSSYHIISLNQVCKDFDKIYDVIKNNYETYVSEFTFSKVKREVEKFRTENITRINKAFSDIQMQIVTIPASVVIVSANFKTGNDFSLKTNSVILFGALFFAIAVYYICENQKDTLKNINHEVQSHKAELEKNPLFIEDNDILRNYTFLNNRYRKQIKNLSKIKMGVLVSIILTIIIYLSINAEYSCLTINIWLLDKFWCPTPIR